MKRLKLKWAFAFEGDITAFAQPTVLDGQVFVGSAAGVIHALRAEAGCIEWTYQANGPVRSAIGGAARHAHALLFSRSHRLVLRARSRNRQAALEETSGGARGHAPDRRADRSQRHRLHAGRFLGRDARARIPDIRAARFAAASPRCAAMATWSGRRT